MLGLALVALRRLAPPSAWPSLVGLIPAGMAGVQDELVADHREFAPLFARAERRFRALGAPHDLIPHGRAADG
jgi:hypothetical protein